MFPSGEVLINEARMFEKPLLNFFYRQGVAHHEGEDLVQEVYLRLWNYRADYRRTAKFSTFLFMLARQVRIDALRRETRRTIREEDWGREQPTSETPRALGARDDARWALAQLSEPLRNVVKLGIVQELPYAEIGRILGIPVGTVKSRMFTALNKLKKVVAASLVALLGLGVVFSLRSRAPAPRVYTVRATTAENEYFLAYLKGDEAVKELIRTQNADGSWKTDFLTRQNAAALQQSPDPAARIAYKKAIRNLRSRGLL